MDTLMILVIGAIIAAIILVEFNKQQKRKQRSNIYSNDKQQLYMFTVAEYKINELENHLEASHTTAAHSNAMHELEELTTAYNNGHIQLNELNDRLDNLLNMLDINSSIMAQAY